MAKVSPKVQDGRTIDATQVPGQGRANPLPGRYARMIQSTLAVDAEPAFLAQELRAHVRYAAPGPALAVPALHLFLAERVERVQPLALRFLSPAAVGR